MSLYFKLASKVIANRFWGFFGKNIPYKVTLISTYQCNSRCQTCNVWQVYQENPKRLEEELSDRQILDFIGTFGKKLFWLNITGGEPTLRKGFDSLVCKIYNLCPDLQLLNIPSNGIFSAKTLTAFERILQECPRLNLQITISLDALEDSYDRIRGVKNGFTLVTENFNALRRLKEKYPQLSVSFQSTISRHNAANIADLFAYCWDKSDNYILTFAQEAKIFHNLNSGVDIQKEKELLAEAVNHSLKYYKFSSLPHLLPILYLRLFRRFLRTKRLPVRCQAGSSTLTIDPYGNILACPYLEQNIGIIDHFDYDIAKIVNSPAMIDARKDVKKCQLCWMNCEAFSAILASPVKSLIKALNL